MGHGGEFWQNVVHWRKEWQTTSVFLPWEPHEQYDQLDSMLKSRDITLPTKIPLVKAMVFPTVMYGYESWSIQKAEQWRIHAFELWFWKRLLRVPWTARISNQSILKEISPEYSLERLMLKLKTPILWPPDAKNWCFWTVVLEKTLESPLDCKDIKPVNPKGN